MQITIAPINTTTSFGGIKMTVPNRQDATKLLNKHLKSPSLQIRNDILEIMEPYILRRAEKIASDGYYYEDSLQNLRLNILDLLDIEHIKHYQKTKQLPPFMETIKNLKTKAFQPSEYTYDVKMAQKDKSIVPWHTLSEGEKEKIIPPDNLQSMNNIEDAEYYLKESKLSKREQLVLKLLYLDGYDAQKVANHLNLSTTSIYNIKNHALKRIRKIHHIKFNS